MGGAVGVVSTNYSAHDISTASSGPYRPPAYSTGSLKSPDSTTGTGTGSTTANRDPSSFDTQRNALQMVPEDDMLSDNELAKSPAIVEYERTAMTFANDLFHDCITETGALAVDEFEEFLKMVLLHIEYRGKKLKKKAVADLSKEILSTLNANFDYQVTGIAWDDANMLLETMLEGILSVRTRLFETKEEQSAQMSMMEEACA